MGSALRSIFRVILVLVFMFIALKTFGILPHGAEAAIRYRSFISRSGGGSYHSNYGGRYVYKGFGSSSNSRRKADENVQEVDQKRLYYEKKMAEWREKKKELQANRTGDSSDSEVKVKESDSGPEQLFDSPTQFTPEKIPDHLHLVDDSDPDFDDADANNQYDYENYVESTTSTSNLTNSTHPPTSHSLSSSTTSSASTSTDKSIAETSKPPRKAYGYRYGRVKVEKL